MTGAHSAMSSTDSILDKLYALPLLKGTFSLSGSTDESAKKLLEKLRDNYVKWHAHFDSRGFHNHLTHHLIAIYGLGASAPLIEAANETHMYQKPAFASPGPITEENFIEHIGDLNYYDSYLKFFSAYVLGHTPVETINRFIFSPEFNYIPNLDVGKKQPAMLERFESGLLHPMIHSACGLEFGILGQLAEGLAQTATHPDHQTRLFPPALFKQDVVNSILNNFASLALSSPSPAAPLRPTFSFHQRVLEEPAFAPGAAVSPDVMYKFKPVIEKVGDRIHQLVTEWYEGWLKGADSEAEIERRLEIMMEEVVFGNVMWFGVSGWAWRGNGGAGKEINADFFAAHFATSTLFLPLFIIPGTSPMLSPPLSLANRLLLLRTYLSVNTAWYISRGRSSLPIADFFDATSSYLSAPLPPQRKSTVPLEERAPAFWPGEVLKSGGNPWLRILQNAIVHPDMHLCKLQRSLAYWAGKYGSRPTGYYSSAHGGLVGVERLDGTLFLRVAGLTEQRMGFANEGEELGLWDRVAFYEGRKVDPKMMQ